MTKQKPVSNYETYEAGTYEENRIEWFTKDDSGNPIFVADKWGNLVARYRTFHDEDEGPPGSVRPGELTLLVKAFGGDPSKIKDPLEDLAVAEAEIANADKTVRVTVGDTGWIRFVQGMALPPGEYTFSYEGLRPTDDDGNPKWMDGQFGMFSIVRLVVDMPESSFNGAGIEVWINREPLNVLRSLIPSVYETLLGSVKDELKVLHQLATEDKAKIYGEIEPDDKGRDKLVKLSLRAMSPDEAVDTGPAKAKPIECLYQAIANAVDEKIWEDSEAFASPGKLSEVGKKWAKEVMAPICKKHNIPKRFEDMSDKQITTLLQELGKIDPVPETDEEPW